MANSGNATPRLLLRPIPDYHSCDSHLYDAQPHDSRSPALKRGADGSRRIDVIARLKKENGRYVPVPENLLSKVVQIKDIVTGTVDADSFLTVRDRVKSLKAATDLYFNLHHSVPAICSSRRELDSDLPKVPGLDGSGVVVGIVDTGCDFAHENFRLGPFGGTRLLYLWDQPQDTGTGLEPYGYGREFSAQEINRALTSTNPYAELRYQPEPAAHGTHVMDIAAGNGRGSDAGRPLAPGVAPNALLIFVDLKARKDDSLGNSKNLLEAVHYIFTKADELGLPAVVNLSLSSTGGPHDGTTLVEQGLERLLERPGRAIVVAAGNAREKRSHVARNVSKGQLYALRWMLDPQSQDNEMELWYDGGKELVATLKSPLGEALGPVKLDTAHDILLHGLHCGRIHHRKDDPNNRDNMIDIQLDQRPELLGTWTLELSTEGPEPVEFHAWIEQGDRGDAHFEGEVTTGTTLGSISGGERTIAVGAFNTLEQASLQLPFEASGAGPTRPSGRQKKGRKKPEVSAPGVGIVAARALGGTVMLSGTSMATAHVTGLVALLFQFGQRHNRPLKAEEIQKALINSTPRRNPNDLGQDWQPQLGYGPVNGVEAVRALRALLEAKAERPPAEAGPPGAVLPFEPRQSESVRAREAKAAYQAVRGRAKRKRPKPRRPQKA